jgi:hypothetical protein
MIEYAKGILSPSGSAVKGLVGAHPVILGIAVGIGAYYAVNKLLLNQDVDDADEMADAEEEIATKAATT